MGDYYLQGWPFWRNVLYALFILWLGHRTFSKHLEGVGKSKPSDSFPSDKQYQIAYKKLLTAVHGDKRLADELISNEHSQADSIGIGKAEAVRRALQRLAPVKQ